MEQNVNEKVKKVFISYSWTNDFHEKWVYELAERLVSEGGVDVVLDKWDLKQGQDKYAFMESMVQDPTIDKVLIICDKGYKEKADNREGGVGTETQILTPELYGKISETRYIPVIAQEGENSFDEYMPNYIKSRIGIVMSSPDSYMKGYEELLRAIYDKPRFIKPKLGNKPSFLDNEVKTATKLKFINKSLSNYINDNRQGMIISTIIDFQDEFYNELNKFIIDNEDFKQPIDEQLIENIDKMIFIRDEYINFIENLIIGYKEFNSDIIIEIFEKLYQYTEYKGAGNSYNNCITEHYKFFITETFIWTNIILFKYKKYNIMKDILYTRYHVESKFENGTKHFSDFRYWLDGLESKNNRLNSKRLCICADKLVERSIYKNKNYKDELVEMDILLYYISKVNEGRFEHWYPVTYIYKGYYRKMELIERMDRKSYFDEVKILFNVEDKQGMAKLIEEKLSNLDRGFSGAFQRIPTIKDSINTDEIAKY